MTVIGDDKDWYILCICESVRNKQFIIKELAKENNIRYLGEDENLSCVWKFLTLSLMTGKLRIIGVCTSVHMLI